jgi:hypothetical protein
MLYFSVNKNFCCALVVYTVIIYMMPYTGIYIYSLLYKVQIKNWIFYLQELQVYSFGHVSIRWI